ncbi:MAG: citramalate synthase [Anaerolineae bacterium]|nr:citramalate synthase [Anaerolineae bacterium]
MTGDKTVPSVLIYDTTLRDGTQREGISLSLEDKLKVTKLLDDFGVAYIEGGWPGSNPKDAHYFEAVRKLDLKCAKVAAFGATTRVGVKPADDENIQMLVDSQAPVVTVVGKTWALHVHEVLRTDKEDNCNLIHDSLAYLKGLGREVVYDAEHFFDGYKDDAEYAILTLKAALQGGADWLTLCDTNGGTMYWEVERIVGEVIAALPAGTKIGIHTHNDGEQGVANSLAAIRVGAGMVQGTINGYGERCGNANLCSIIPDLELKMGYTCLPEGKLKQITNIARTVAEIANLPPDHHLAYVGRSAFAHKGGIHVAAMRRTAKSYQHIEPELVGNEMRVLISDLSGRGNILSKAEQFGMDVSNDAARQVLEQIKHLENLGYAFEGAEASVAIMLKRAQPDYQAPFELIDFMTVVESRQGRGLLAEATVKLSIGGEVMHTAAEGNGPVNALDLALRKAIAPAFPRINEFHLADYKVRILDSYNGSSAITRVLVDTQNGTHRWSTVGAAGNIIEASWRALIDSIEYGLLLAH